MAELKLDVTLNIAGFRAQLEKLATEAGSRYFGVDLSIDEADFKKQLKELEKIKPIIKINDDQLYGARKTIGALNKSLATLRRATSTPIEIKIKYVEIGKPPSGATKEIANTVSRGVKVSQAIEGFSSGQLRSTRRAMGEAGLNLGKLKNLQKASTDELKESIVYGFNNSAEEAINGFVAGLKDGNSKVAFAAGKVGKEGVRGINDALGIESPSKVFKRIGELSVDGLEIGFLNGLKSFKSKSIAEVSAIVIALKAEFAKLQGALPAPAGLSGGSRGGRGYFNPIGPLPEGSKEPYTMTDRGYQPYLGGPGVGPSAPPRGLLPPASAIGRGFSGQSFAGAPVNFRMGADLPALPSSEAAKRLRQQEQVAQGTAERLRQQARVAQAHLRSAERSATVFGERAARLDKAMSAFRTSGRATGYTSPIGPLPRNSSEPYAAGSRGMFGSSGFEPRLESRPVAGLLPPSLTPTREQIVAARTQVARERSNARALQVQLDDQFKQMQFNPTVPRRRDYFQPGMQPLLPGGGTPPRSGGIPPGVGAAVGGSNVPVGGGVPPRGGGGGGGGVPRGGNIPPSGGGGAGGGAPGFPSTQLGAGYYSVGKALNSVKSSYGQVKEFLNTKALPLTGAITGLAGEFGGAIKQVLLFGTAYKALAFLTSIPGEALDAAKGLATYKNQLKAVTSESQTFDQSLAFVDNLAQRFNTPLESARQGFVKLYASMQPVGFNQGEIENLFTGISKAAAAFGLSSDKVDRVNYAFAQMASKGQIMSEELKGQLGDVLPGALALFAKAAQMNIPEFTKAMEDGAFQGKAMQQVLGNVAILMNSQYGPAAEGAAKTLQGAVNQIQNNLKLMYESFAPVVDAFAAAFGPKINSLIKDVSSTIKVLTGDFGKLAKEGEGFSALSPQAQFFYTTIKTLEPSLRQAGAAVLDLASRFAMLIPAIVQTIATAISFASSPLARAAILAAIAIGTLTAALAILEVIGLKAALKAVYAFISGLFGIPTATGAARLGIIALKLALTGIVVGAILMGLDLLISKLFGIGDAAAKSRKEIQELDRELDAMAGAGDLDGTTKVYLEANTNLVKASKKSEDARQKLENLKKDKPKGMGTAALQQAAIEREGAQKEVDTAFNEELLARKQVQLTRTARDNAKNIKERRTEESLKAEGKLEKIDLSGKDDGKAAEREARLQDKLASREQQLDMDAANRQVALDQSSFDSRLRMSDAEYDYKRALQDDYFAREISGLDSIEARQKKFQQDLKAIENRRIDSIRKAELDAVKAVQDLRSATVKAAAVSGAPGAAKFGDTGRTFNAPGFVHGHAQNMDRGALKSDSTALIKSLLQQGVTPELSSGAKFDRSMSDAQIADLVGRGIAAHKQYASGAGAIDIFVPKGTSVPAPLSNVGNLGGAAGVTGTMPGGSQLMHLDPSSKSSSVGIATRSGAFAMGRREDKAEGNLAVEQQDVQNKALEKLETIRRANNLALEQTITLVQQNIDSIFPVKEQKLENDLLEMRNNLELKGASKEIIDMEVQKYKAVKENAYNLQILNERIAKNNEELTKLKGKKIATLEDKEQIKSLTNLTAGYNLEIAGIPEKQRLFNEQLERTAALAVESPMVKLAKQVNEAKRELVEMSSASSMAIGGAKSIGEAFGSSFKDMINGSKTVKESMASLFQSVGDYFLDMAGRIISKWIEMQAIQGLMSIFNMFAPGAAVAGGLPNSSYAGGGGEALTQAGSFGGNMFSNAEGINFGSFGIGEFANGGMVTSPTLGLVGEGKYNEAIIPLPDGKSVPVDLGGMSDGLGNNITSNIVVNVNSDGQSSSNANGSNSVDLGRKIEGAVKQVIVAELRPGGVLAGRR